MFVILPHQTGSAFLPLVYNQNMRWMRRAVSASAREYATRKVLEARRLVASTTAAYTVVYDCSFDTVHPDPGKPTPKNACGGHADRLKVPRLSLLSLRNRGGEFFLAAVLLVFCCAYRCCACRCFFDRHYLLLVRRVGEHTSLFWPYSPITC